MTHHRPWPRKHGLRTVFDERARARFARRYPEEPHMLRHRLSRDPRLEIEALARLGERLPAHSVEYNRGDLPIGVDGKPQATGLTIGETIRRIDEANSWAVLKNIEQDNDYRELLESLLGELREAIEHRTGPALTPQGFIFVSSPGAITPYHFDPEHNILLQIRGSKTMTQFPAGDPRFAPDEAHEAYHAGGPRELRWREEWAACGQAFELGEGDALYVPVMAPHFVCNGPTPSISLSITWRSEWSYAEADARALNRLMRKLGLGPRPPRRWPHSNRAKALAYRTLRKLKLVD